MLGVRDAFEAIKDEFKDALAAEKDQVDTVWIPCRYTFYGFLSTHKL